MTAPRHPAAPPSPAPNEARPRLEGVDLARWAAIAGMLIVHFSVPFVPDDTVTAWLTHQAAWGRSTILFTFLAGVSLALISGTREPHRGSQGHVTAGRVAVRGVVLMLIGWTLTSIVAPTEAALTVIITYYGLYFLLAVPFLRLNAKWSAAAAVTAVIVGPQLLYALRRSNDVGGRFFEITQAWNQSSPGHIFLEQGLLDLAVYGLYPALSYVAVVLAGLAVGRLDLRSHTVRLGIAALGLLLNSVAYRASWHAWESYRLVEELGPREEYQGPLPTEDARWLLSSVSHTATTPEIVGGTGLAMAVLVACLYLADHLPRLLRPFIATGTLALTVYVAHGLAMVWQANLDHTAGGLSRWLNESMPEVFVVGSIVFGLAWHKIVGRGPLEALVSTVSRAVVPGTRPSRGTGADT
ncbi:heparan-alpha-glucosaminide N-acetyltransferase domain-containing protein [Nocardiopsis xinjiangensis]|uniref:heparan-alpha-glucosaminide N-acetyltransferase domain-containing protein n=1 Tax=Nocardiopsis xinjiangensis TaxID=124285 RepID=UPI001F4D1769|nr:heparan-alpha-glucosaminide N-acetyltransferase domain-containing protein [Nocardiopsis xinjiangensis]